MAMNPFDRRDLENFRKQMGEKMASDMMLELETQAEFEFDENIAKEIKKFIQKKSNYNDSLIEEIFSELAPMLKKTYAHGASFDFLKIMEMIYEGARTK